MYSPQRRRLALVSLLVCLCTQVYSAAPRPASRWEVIGPGGGGALFEPTVSPQDPDRALVACDMTGAYITDDGGNSWRMFNLRGRVRFFALDPHNKDVIYAQSVGLWRSEDAGRTWSLVYPNVSDAKHVTVEMPNDHANETIATPAGPVASITALAIDPADSRTLYAGFHQGGTADLRISPDGGRTWKQLFTLTSAATKIFLGPASTGQARAIYAVESTTLAILENGHWEQRPLPRDSTAVLDAAVSFAGSGKPTIYVVTNTGLLISDDSGASWRIASLPGNSGRIRAVAASPGHPQIAYVSYSGLKDGRFGFGKTWFGVARTGDAGHSWDLIWKEADQPAPNVHDAWITSSFGPGYAGNPIALAVAPSNPDIVYATDYGRVLRSADAGNNWQAIYSSSLTDGTYKGRGLENTTSYGVHFDPFDRNRMFVSYTDIGLFRSENGGQSWAVSTTGAPPAWRNNTYWMVFDPDVRGRAWAVMSAVHDLPRPKMWARKSPSQFDGGVTISDNGGRTWRKSNAGMLPTAATHILLDPASPKDARVLYVAAFGRGVYKSVDGGKTWWLKNQGIQGDQPFAWRLSRDTAGTLYLVVARRSGDGSIGNRGDGSLYRSTDGAEHWTPVKLPAGVNGPTGLTTDPTNRRRLYLAAWGRNTPHHAQGGGVFVSDDGGGSWRRILQNDEHIYDVTLDPHKPDVIYATGFESSAWRSLDRGNSWRRIAGFDFKWGHRVIPDPADPERLYITTFGGGVWHGPAAGSAGLSEILSRLP